MRRDEDVGHGAPSIPTATVAQDPAGEGGVEGFAELDAPDDEPADGRALALGEALAPGDALPLGEALSLGTADDGDGLGGAVVKTPCWPPSTPKSRIPTNVATTPMT